MHPESRNIMQAMINKIPFGAASVLDVGSMDVNGTFRPMIEKRGWEYLGLDVVDGPNVDLVVDDPFSYPIEDGAFDVVISGSTMEHVTAIWLWIPEIVRLIKPGGYLCIHTHWKFQEHLYPVDCWRILPDGMRYLFDMTNLLEDYDIRITNDMDIMGFARRGA